MIELSDGDALRFEVRDDGAGFDPEDVVGGVGFTSMRDRLATVGGELAVITGPGRAPASPPDPARQGGVTGRRTRRGPAAPLEPPLAARPSGTLAPTTPAG